VSCYNALSGELIYKKEVENVSSCWASPWAYNGSIYFLDQKGLTHVFKAGENFEVLPGNKLDDKFWASVAIIRNAYIFKGVKLLYCIKKS
jgi:hypothetical protein